MSIYNLETEEDMISILIQILDMEDPQLSLIHQMKQVILN